MWRLRASEGSADGPGTKKNRTLSISAIIILVLTAVAGIAYYVGTPPLQPEVQTDMAACTAQSPLVVIPQDMPATFTPPTLTVVVGVNNTVGWRDQDSSGVRVVASMSTPPGSVQWDFNMTSGETYCVGLTVPGTYNYEIGFSPVVAGMIIVKTAS